MKKMTLIAAALAGVLAISGCAGGTKQGEQTPGGEEQVKKVIVMGTNAEFPPFEFKEGGEIDGFDVAVAKEIAKDLGAELKIEDMNFDSLLTALAAGKVDFVGAAMTVRPDREENADFSAPYYKAKQVIIVKKGSDKVKTVADLDNKKIGVQEGTTGDFAVSEEEGSDVKGADVNRFKKAIDAVMDLKNGKLDAVVVDINPAQEFVKANDDLEILGVEFIDEDYAFAVKKGNTELVNSINATIAAMKEDGRFDSLIDKYINE